MVIFFIINAKFKILFFFQLFKIIFVINSTFLQFFVLGPKFQLGKILFFNSLLISLCPTSKYPLKGSRTCCHGLVAFLIS